MDDIETRVHGLETAQATQAALTAYERELITGVSVELGSRGRVEITTTSPAASMEAFTKLLAPAHS